MTPRKVAVLGAWHVHAGDYARQVQQHPDTELVAVWDDDPVRGRALADAYGIEHTHDLAGLLARVDVAAVTVTTATAAHHEVIMAAAQAGKHIFAEKLLAPTVAECEEIITACDRVGVTLMVSLPRLYQGFARAINERLAGDQLGKVTHSRIRMSHAGALNGVLPERFFDPVEAIGGAFTDLGCHPAYLTQAFLGGSPETVSATYRSVTGRPVEDHAVVTVGYSNGAIGIIEAGFVSKNPFHVEVNGTRGSIRYSWPPRHLAVIGEAFEATEWRPIDLPEHGPDPLARWLDHIDRGARDDDNLTRAVDLTRLVVAANRSAAENRVVRMTEEETR